MSYKIVVDSCCDLTEEMNKSMNVETVPLTIELDGQRYVDDKTLDIGQLLDNMKNSKTNPKTSCPSPQDYIDSFEGEEENVFVVTLSNQLSGSNNSAQLAKSMYDEENKTKNIHIFDSLSASIGETLIALKINELTKLGKKPKEIIDTISQYIKDLKTMFVLERLDNLEKSGRLSYVAARLADVLSIKPVLASNGHGNIIMKGRARGVKKALKKMIELIGKQNKKLEDLVLGIAHCNCLSRAEWIKEEVQKLYNFKDIIITETRGISTVYADDGGIVIAF